MSGYLVNSVCGPVVAPMVARDKGDLSNRCQTAKEQVVNNFKTAGAMAATGAGAYGLVRYAMHGENANKFARVFDKSVDGAVRLTNKVVGGLQKVAPKLVLPAEGGLVSELIGGLKGLSGKAKALAMILTPAALLMGYINNKHFYQQGQIDQRGTDRAMLKERAQSSLNFNV